MFLLSQIYKSKIYKNVDKRTKCIKIFDMYEVDHDIFDSFRHEKNPIMAEKDYLECVILERLFDEPFFKQNFVFAGGGTITKVYKIGSRIGQDIDLAFTDFEDLPETRGTKKLNNFKDKFIDFVFNDLNKEVTKAVKDIGEFTIITDRQIRASQPIKTGRALPTLYCSYTSNLNPKINKCINIEFIPRHYDPESIENHAVVPYSLGTPSTTEIPTVHYAQTFWDKIYALYTVHQIGVMRSGLAHHYYDVANLAPCVKLDQTQNMFKSIEKYQKVYTTRKMESPEHLCDLEIMPTNDDLQKLAEEYSNMSNRFIGRQETWNNILCSLQTLNKNIKSL